MNRVTGPVRAWLCLRKLRGATEEHTPELAFTSTRAKCVAVYDGDTVTLVAPLRDGAKHLFKVKARIRGIDTPELRTRDLAEKAAGMAAGDALRKLVLGRLLHVTWHRRGKYGRELVSLRVRKGGRDVDIARFMLAEGHAREYDGGKRVTYAQWAW